MTTKVTIANDSANDTTPHVVTVRAIGDNGNLSETTLKPGASGEWHVFDGMRLEVTEATAVETDAAAGDATKAA